MFLSYTQPPLEKTICDVTDKLKKMLKDSQIIISLVKSFRLKLYMSIINSLTNSMIKKIDSNDILIKNLKLSKLDFTKAFIVGAFKSLTTRTKKTGRIL